MRLTLRRPDDLHLHLRDGAMLEAVLPHTAASCARALVMPNLKPPVATVAQALAYRDRILAALPAGSAFRPLMTLYLTDRTTIDEVQAAAAHPDIVGVKLYPAGATTHSDAGVTDLDALDPVLDAMAQCGLVFCVHGEVTDAHVDIFDREARFLDEVLAPLLERHPTLKVVIEHATTAEATQLARSSDRLAASITAHHLRYDRNAMFAGGLRPHLYCLPVLKRSRHREALVAAATSGDPSFFYGSDSAPHLRSAKESECGCAGLYTAPVALPMLAELFEEQGALDRLEDFTSTFGANFYGLPLNEGTLELVREPFVVPEIYAAAGEGVRPAEAGSTLSWRVTG